MGTRRENSIGHLPGSIKFLIVASSIVTILTLVVGYSYLLFHALIELFAITVGFSLFIIVWNTEDLAENSVFRTLGYAYCFVAFIDVLHTLAYKGMGVFPGFGADLPTQLWIIARYVEAFSLLLAPQLTLRNLSRRRFIMGYGLLVGVLLATVFSGIFPSAFVEGSGLTPFKVGSEYLIIGILFVAAFVYHSKYPEIVNDSRYYLLGAIGTTILAELSFTLYMDVYGIANMIGHYLKLISFFLIYRGTTQYTLENPISALFGNLKRKERSLLAANEAIKLSNRIMHHDVRNALQIAQMNLELWREDQNPEFVSRADESITNANNIIEDVEEMSAASNRNDSSKPVRISNLLRYVPYRDRLNFEGDCIVGAGPGISSVLVNLIINSVEHGNASEIVVEASSRSDKCIIRVIDNGKGIPEKQQDKIFEEGYSGPNSDGLGMGLYIAKEVVQLYDGEVTLVKSQKGETVFRIELPLTHGDNEI